MAELCQHVVAHLEITFDTVEVTNLTPEDASNVDELAFEVKGIGQSDVQRETYKAAI
jgi:hypothetical protein